MYNVSGHQGPRNMEINKSGKTVALQELRGKWYRL